MFVDDEPRVLAALARLFRRDPDLQVHVALDGLDALRKLEHHRMDLVVSDFCMPGMNGVELLCQVSRLYPGTRLAILSAYPEVQAMIRCFQGRSLPPFFSKPWDNDHLHRSLRRLIRLPAQAPDSQTLTRSAA